MAASGAAAEFAASPASPADSAGWDSTACGGEDDCDESCGDFSQQEASGLEMWLAAGGRERLEQDIKALNGFAYAAAYSTRPWSSEVCVGVEVPFARLGLSTEHSHSLRLEEGSCVLVKLVARVSEHNARGILQPSSQPLAGRQHRALVLPEATFVVRKARPKSVVSMVSKRSDATPAEEAADAEFGVRWSLEHLLNSFFPSVLAVESAEHVKAVGRVANATSLPFVRRLRHDLPVDSQDYASPHNLDRLQQALEQATQEAMERPGREFLDDAQETLAAEQNLLLRMVHFVRHQIELATYYCLVCHEPMPPQLQAIKPFVCDNALCTHQFEELSLGANPDLEVESNGEVVDLLISLAFHHCTKTISNLPVGLPTWDLIKGFRRCAGTLEPDDTDSLRLHGKGTDFRREVRQGDWIKIVKREFSAGNVLPVREVKKVMQVSEDWLDVDEALTLELDGSECFYVLSQDRDRQAWDIGFEMASVIDRMPTVKEMQGWVGMGFKIKERLDEKDERLFPLLRWILCSFRGHLRYITDSQEAIPELQAQGFKQFVMMCCTPAHEAKFQAHASQWPVRNAFHGSPIGNWHSILRNGLNFSKTLHGRSYGDGIYLALDASVSLGYTHSARHGGAGSQNSRLGSYALASQVGMNMGWETADGLSWVGGKSIFDSTLACLAVVDCIYRPNDFVSSTPHWVVPQAEWVVTRFLCVKDKISAPSSSHGIYAHGPSIPASTLSIPASARAAVSRHDTAPAPGVVGPATTWAPGVSEEHVNGVRAEDEQTKLKQLCVMFADVEPSCVKSVLASVSYDVEEALLHLSGISSAKSQRGASKRPLEACSSDKHAAQHESKCACIPQRLSAQVDLTLDSDEDCPQGTSSTGAVRVAKPSKSAVEQVVSVLTHLKREEAVALLQRNHNSAEDAIMSALV